LSVATWVRCATCDSFSSRRFWLKVLLALAAAGGHGGDAMRLPRADLSDLSLSWPMRGVPNGWRTLFSLRCDCGDLTAGCRDHWLCGLCEPCREALEAGMPVVTIEDL